MFTKFSRALGRSSVASRLPHALFLKNVGSAVHELGS